MMMSSPSAEQNTAGADALAAKREALRAEIAKVSAEEVPVEVREALARADAFVAAKKSKFTELQGELDAVDDQLGVRRHALEEEAARRWREADLARRNKVAELAEQRLERVAEAQRHLRAFVASLSEAFDAHMALHHAAGVIAEGARLPMGLSTQEFISRMGGRIAGILRQTKVPGGLRGNAARIGSLELPNASLYPATQDWRESEDAATKRVVDALIEGRLR
jgi:hypothetical protein